MNVLEIGGELGFEELITYLEEGQSIALSNQSIERVTHCRNYVDSLSKEGMPSMYGINTGFGSLCNTPVSHNELSELQRNLVVSHACGVGSEIPQELVRLMLMLKVQSLSKGYSGIALETLERLVVMHNQEILPIVYSAGSLGASGDLAPLAHLSLPLLGEGEVMCEGERISGAEMLEKMNWKPLQLKSKEGLALLNGTQFMLSFACYNLYSLYHAGLWADTLAAWSLDVFNGRYEAFEAKTHAIRPHKGQMDVAERIRKILSDSEGSAQHKAHVQDPYSFRCVPQVHGASWNAWKHCMENVLVEINAVTDNPNVFPEEGEVISAGNFHGQVLALSLDYAGIAAAEWASISERRIYKLISGERDLPAYLTPNAGLHSGFMIAQYAAASLVSKNKQLSTPASVDSIVSSNGQEDHVSMGANAATALHEIVENVWQVLAIELLLAAQGRDFRNYSCGALLEELHAAFRRDVPFLEKDVVLQPHIEKAEEFLWNNASTLRNFFESSFSSEE